MPATTLVEGDRGQLGSHRLANFTIGVPPERDSIGALQDATFEGWSAVDEASSLGLLREFIRHAELSPTFTCPEDCGGCPDRVSLHLGDPAEQRIQEEQWFGVVDRLRGLGVTYFMLIGGTIDRQPVTPRLMTYILEKNDGSDVGWFTDGIMLQNPHTGAPTPLLQRLIEQGRMKELTTHVSADFLVPEGVVVGGPILDPKKRWENEHGGSRYYKSAFGERLARRLIDIGVRRVVLNTAISTHNLDEVIPIYDFVASLQEYAQLAASPTVVLHTFSPWVWRPHLARGDDPRNYDSATLLRPEHYEQLRQISEYILADTLSRLKEGRPRVAGNSSGFISGIPFFGITQDIPYEHGSSELAVQPDGLVRMDPLFVRALMLKHALNPYGYRDRDIDHNPFDGFSPEGVSFPNLIQTTRTDDILWR